MVKVRVRSRRRRSRERENLRRSHAKREDPLLFLALYGIGLLVVVSLGVAAFSGLDRLYNPQEPKQQPRTQPTPTTPSI
jgi:hypothetical protein